MHKKGQGALEYLLLIGGAILVAIVVITILTGLATPGGTQTNESTARSICAAKPVLPSTACIGSAVNPAGSSGQDVNVGAGASRVSCSCQASPTNSSLCESYNCCTGANCQPAA